MNNIHIVFQLIVAAVLGSLVGIERQYRRKEAGLRTYCLVTLGACIFTIAGIAFFDSFLNKTGVSFNPGSIIQAMAIGIGFLGAGVILHQQSGTVGLTTAAGLWTTAAIGVAVGLRLYVLAVCAAILVFLIFSGLGWAEEKLIRANSPRESENK